MVAESSLVRGAASVRPLGVRRNTRLSLREGWRRGDCLTGCLVVLGVLAILGVIAGIWLANNWRDLAAEVLTPPLIEAIERSDMTEEDKVRVIAQVEALSQEFRDKKISLEEMGRVIEEIAESPVLPVAAVMFVEEQYIRRSGLSEEEKADARLQIGRLARGVFEEKIDEERIRYVVEPISEPGSTGDDFEIRPPDRVSDDDLRRMIERAREEADAAEIPDEAFLVDIPGELERAIEKALGRRLEVTPRETTPPPEEPVEPADPADPGETPPPSGG